MTSQVDSYRGRIVLALLLAGSLAVIYLVMRESDFRTLFTDPGKLVTRVHALGVLGPALLIGLMALAIVFNPLPSAPIALAAGAVYGHTWGTVYIVAGAEIGALLAFAIARWAGYDLTRRFFGESGKLRKISSQNSLTLIVFISRLVPFMSFDLISYAAGLSPIKPWRFAMATLLGLLPISFALAHFGAEAGSGDYATVITVILLIGLLTAVPVILRSIRRQKSTLSQ